MKILIDSGNAANIGDNAMLFNIVNYLGENIDGMICVIDRQPFFPDTLTRECIRVVNFTRGLLKMPHWRVRTYRTQPWVCKYTCVFIFWLISVSRALRLAFETFFYGKFKFHFFSSKDIKYAAEILSNMDVYWVVGGGNINDIWIEEAFWKFALAGIFKLQGKPVIFSGQGIGPLKRLDSKLIVRYGIKQANLVGLREKASFKTLESLNANPKKFFVVCDDALTVSNSIQNISRIIPDKFIALNLRLSFYSFQKNEIIDRCVQLITLLMDEYSQYQFIFIPIAFNRLDSDVESARMIKARLNTNRISIHEKALSYENIKFVLKDASFAIGGSYHFCLFSLAVGIPCVGLYANDYYEQKLTGLMEMFDRENGTFDLRDNTAEGLFRGIQHSFSEFDKSKILSAKARMERDWYNFMSLAETQIKNNRN